MRTASFSKEKHLPVRRFIADESKVATGLYGPRAIADDLDNLLSMFDPDATFLDGSQQGGISEKNLQNGTVSYEKLGEDVKEKLQGIATEQQLSSLHQEFSEKHEEKADKADTLDGYGITNAYTKQEVDAMHAQLVTASDYMAGMESKADKETVSSELFQKANKATSLSGYGITDAYTREDVDALLSEQETNNSQRFLEQANEISKKTEEIILYEDVVNTPAWTHQPNVLSGEVASHFVKDDFYYVTLKDADGNALPDGQFMLKDFYTDDATVYPVLFSLENLHTGTDTLIENYPVEFTSVGAVPKMRDAGVWEVAYNPSEWKLNGNYGSLSFVCDGQFIQRTSSAYFISQFQTDKNVSHYHSVNTTAYQTDSDSRNMGVYISLNDGKSYKTNKFYNEFTITRISDTRYKTQRTVTLRYINFADGTPKVISAIEFGHGEIQQGDTFLKKMNVQVAAVTNRGCIRNGSVIRVTEVK